MTNVVAIGEATVLGSPDRDVIDALKGLLKDAEAGELRAVAFATIRHNGGVSIDTGWSGCAGTRYPLGAAIGILNTRYHTALMTMD